MNRNRRSKRAYQLWRHHFYKWNYPKAISSFERAREISTRYFFNEQTLYLLSESYYYHWNIEKSLDVINEAIEYSPSYLDGLEFKLFLLEELWISEQLPELSVQIDKLKKMVDNANLDNYVN